MRLSYLVPILFAAAVAGAGNAKAQTVVVEDDVVAPPVWAPAVPAIVPPSPLAAPGVVVLHRQPIVAAPPVVVAPRAPLLAAEPVVVAPGSCIYGYC
ncbi:hypothetical protein [Bradyrhizobium sp.]|uniref:hypothetical protein n=1 Tax=Bradyrhizobium sp. TaxID=376 RepID=UPI002398242B|nr:hypothetical protein [Bradyrhizobium sp.]MDE1932904.1 hypothetical protein [Bradyrhizobium sp.]